MRDALLTVHRPPRDADVDALLAGTHSAQRRLALEELLAHNLSLRRQRIALQSHGAVPLHGDTLAERLRASLPFALTAAQRFSTRAARTSRTGAMLRWCRATSVAQTVGRGARGMSRWSRAVRPR